MKPIHVMFDLETIGARDGAPIVQIGAVLFQPHGHVEVAGQVALDQGTISAPGTEFRACIEMEPWRMERADWSTIQWWLTRTSDRARQRVFGDQTRVGIGEALIDFTEWSKSWGTDPTYWWSDMDFDLRLMRQAYENHALQADACPFGNNLGPHRGVRDYRTLRWIGRGLGIEPAPFVGVEHDALDDAYAQAYYAVKVLRHLGMD